MKAIVKSSGRVIDVQTYVDRDSNPYKEEELDFNILDECEQSDESSESDITKIFFSNRLGYAVQIATQYMQHLSEQEVGYTPYRVANFTEELLLRLEKI